MSGIRLGILRLGRVTGKSKYALIDERDISVVQQYAIEPKVEVDKNGNGACIYAVAHDIGRERTNGRYLHELLWETHKGGIAPGWRVMHKNHVTVDNRLDNLELVKDTGVTIIPRSTEEGAGSHLKNRENSLYWITVTQLLGDPQEITAALFLLFIDFELPQWEDPLVDPGYNLTDMSDFTMKQMPNHKAMATPMYDNGTCTNAVDFSWYSENPNFNRWCDSNGDVVDAAGETFMYYECHYPPCTHMEREFREFKICSRCKGARYCSASCQERDWPSHKKYCRERRKHAHHVGESTPER